MMGPDQLTPPPLPLDVHRGRHRPRGGPRLQPAEFRGPISAPIPARPTLQRPRSHSTEAAAGNRRARHRDGGTGGERAERGGGGAGEFGGGLGGAEGGRGGAGGGASGAAELRRGGESVAGSSFRPSLSLLLLLFFNQAASFPPLLHTLKLTSTPPIPPTPPHSPPRP